MDLIKRIDIPRFDFEIEPDDKILTIGSCFAENMAEKFRYYRFNVMENPFGVLYNPASILNAVKLLQEDRKFVEDDLIYFGGEYHSFFHHSDFSWHEKETALKRINEGISSAKLFLENSNVLIVSLGTAYVFEYLKDKIIVSNCHKIPGGEFDRKRLTVEETGNYLSETLDIINEMNPGIRVILTVSPVRHWRDGAVNNNRSKAALLLAVESVTGQFENVEYFPSYEIMMDELRDYRFYDKDMLHPNSLAVDYIWERLEDALFSQKCREYVKETGKIARARLHRPRNTHSLNYRKFLESNLALIKRIKENYGADTLEDDLDWFSSKLVGPGD